MNRFILEIIPNVRTTIQISLHNIMFNGVIIYRVRCQKENLGIFAIKQIIYQVWNIEKYNAIKIIDYQSTC